MERELRIEDDLAAAAVSLFVELRPGTVVLSGGSTPRDFYRRLAWLDHPWEQVEFFFGDERCVPPGSEDSNLRMAEEALLSKVSARAFPIDGERCDAEGYERALRIRFGEAPRFDLALYGLGADGHVASLFPGGPEVEETRRWAVRVPTAGQPPFVPRVSLTVPVLSAARLGLFLVSGEKKRAALRGLLDGEDLPAARLEPERLLILADPAAAALQRDVEQAADAEGDRCRDGADQEHPDPRPDGGTARDERH